MKWLSTEDDFVSAIVVSDESLRRPIESTQYVSIKYSSRLAEAGVEPSVSSVGDRYVNALAETINRLYKAERIWRRAGRGETSRRSSSPRSNAIGERLKSGRRGSALSSGCGRPGRESGSQNFSIRQAPTAVAAAKNRMRRDARHGVSGARGSVRVSQGMWKRAPAEAIF
jgi:hypothetical protein